MSQWIGDSLHRNVADRLHPNLIGFWKLDEGEGQIVADSSTVANHGFLGTSATSITSDPVWSISECSSYVPVEETAASALVLGDPESSMPEDDITIQIYPNPLTDQSLLKFSGATLNSEDARIRIVNKEGVVVYSGDYIDSGLILGKHLNPGIYMLFIESRQRFISKD